MIIKKMNYNEDESAMLCNYIHNLINYLSSDHLIKYMQYLNLIVRAIFCASSKDENSFPDLTIFINFFFKMLLEIFREESKYFDFLNNNNSKFFENFIDEFLSENLNLKTKKFKYKNDDTLTILNEIVDFLSEDLDLHFDFFVMFYKFISQIDCCQTFSLKKLDLKIIENEAKNQLKDQEECNCLISQISPILFIEKSYSYYIKLKFCINIDLIYTQSKLEDLLIGKYQNNEANFYEMISTINKEILHYNEIFIEPLENHFKYEDLITFYQDDDQKRNLFLNKLEIILVNYAILISKIILLNISNPYYNSNNCLINHNFENLISYTQKILKNILNMQENNFLLTNLLKEVIKIFTIFEILIKMGSENCNNSINIKNNIDISENENSGNTFSFLKLSKNKEFINLLINCCIVDYKPFRKKAIDLLILLNLYV